MNLSPCAKEQCAWISSKPGDHVGQTEIISRRMRRKQQAREVAALCGGRVWIDMAGTWAVVRLPNDPGYRPPAGSQLPLFRELSRA